MNPYALLGKLHEVGGLEAILVKKNGDRIDLLVSPEANESKEFEATEYPAALKIRFWSCAGDALGEVRPEEGDALAVQYSDCGRVYYYKTTRDPLTSRYWSYKYDHNKARIVFVTKFEAQQ